MVSPLFPAARASRSRAAAVRGRARERSPARVGGRRAAALERAMSVHASRLVVLRQLLLGLAAAVSPCGDTGGSGPEPAFQPPATIFAPHPAALPRAPSLRHNAPRLPGRQAGGTVSPAVRPPRNGRSIAVPPMDPGSQA